MKVAGGLALVLLAVGAVPLSAQESTFRLNPYAGWFHVGEGSFEEAFPVTDVAGDPIYGARLAIGTPGAWSVDLAYGRTSIDVEVFNPDGGPDWSDVTVQLFYAALDWHLPLTGPLDLFLSGGAGGIDTGSYENDNSDGRTDLLLNYGIGAALPIGALSLRADLKDQVDLCDAPEEFDPGFLDACLEDKALHNIELTAGVEIPL